MVFVVSMDGAGGVLLLALPWLLLAIAAWRTARSEGDDRLRQRLSPREHRHPDVRGAPRPTRSETPAMLAATAPPPPDDAGAGLSPHASPGPALYVPDVDPPLPPGSVPVEPVHDLAFDRDRAQEMRLVAALEAGEAGNDAAALTRDSVALARLLLKRDERPPAEALLRKAVMIARRGKLPEAHAEARLELAALAHADGDLTSACEHWQMAKLMFHEVGRRGERDRVAEVMRQSRCPTDWILTEF